MMLTTDLITIFELLHKDQARLNIKKEIKERLKYKGIIKG